MTSELSVTRISELESERESYKNTANQLAERVAKAEAERDVLKAALKSIANNTCCCKCQEAALVAKATLAAREG